MAKVGKMQVHLPPEWFIAAEEQFADRLEAAGAAVAGNLPSQYESGVTMMRNRNGRLVAMVTLRHPNGVLIQAKTGALTRAAAAAGLDVHRYPPPRGVGV